MTMMRMLCLTTLTLLLAACGGPKREKLEIRFENGDLTVDEAFLVGEELMQEAKYQEARQWYRVIENKAPNSRYISEAKLKIADSYFFDRMATYIEASVEYKSFLTHFPLHPKADYALYQYAMCFFTEIESADRDQTSTWTAFNEFKNLIDRYPNSPYAEKAKAKMDLCTMRLAEHEFYVGYYYFRRGRGFEISAEGRLKEVIDNYEGHYDPVKTYFYLAETLWRREKFKEAMFYYRHLNKNYPKSEYQLFVQDKMARWERIQNEGEDPGEIMSGAPNDPLRDY